MSRISICSDEAAEDEQRQDCIVGKHLSSRMLGRLTMSQRKVSIPKLDYAGDGVGEDFSVSV
jgi:hypothetical protein